MCSKELGNINQALYILKHFIDLIAKLIPILYDLESWRNLSPTEYQNKIKIREIYENNNIDTSTSLHLIDSNVLELIKNSFDAILYDNRVSKIQHLKSFLAEHKRLQQQWNTIASN